ncbi:thiamine phosphate synthase [Halomarina ordinaria]|uniref:Thiamine-phosphate synthase n=1 Tax=Halomarina ordinaria TaxID=3033939 RepID=A0ABD5U8U4_9EURY|nr:thiamine phosphate synthase [Halomarina sp. PSRA2]
MNPDDLRVYLVTQQHLSAGRSTPAVVADALAGGATFVQLREKDRPARERYEVGRRVRELTAEADVPFVVNDRVDLALALDADGVHLGDDDLPVPVARDLLGDDAIVGRSVSTVAAAREAVDAGADYLGVGAVFATGSKDVDPADADIGLERVRDVADSVDVPFVGIGGITADNAARVVEAGADGVAVISALTDAPDVAAAARALREAVDRV